MKFKIVTVLFFLFMVLETMAQPVLSTGGKRMPDEWIDSATGHKVIRLTRREGNSLSFYFHNRPFIGNKMVFYGTSPKAAPPSDQKVEISNMPEADRQIYLLDLSNLAIEKLTNRSLPMNGEIVYNKGGKVYYQIKDSVFEHTVRSGQTRLVFVFPSDFKAGITTINANGTLLGGAWASDEEKEILRKNPGKGSYFNLIYEAKFPRTLFTIDVKTGQLNKLFTDSAWLNHVQFSSTDPNLLMFCHEGPWHLVDRIWNMNISTGAINLVHKRSMPMEIAGHEWFSSDGKTIFFDLQQPRSQYFFVGAYDVQKGTEQKYSLTRDEWSVHFNSNRDNSLFCGDGGDPGQVARAKNGQWIYLFKPTGERFESEKLVDMRHHNYKLEPNVMFSPDGKMVIFRANFEGFASVYGVELEK